MYHYTLSHPSSPAKHTWSTLFFLKFHVQDIKLHTVFYSLFCLYLHKYMCYTRIQNFGGVMTHKTCSRAWQPSFLTSFDMGKGGLDPVLAAQLPILNP